MTCCIAFMTFLHQSWSRIKQVTCLSHSFPINRRTGRYRGGAVKALARARKELDWSSGYLFLYRTIKSKIMSCTIPQATIVQHLRAFVLCNFIRLKSWNSTRLMITVLPVAKDVMAPRMAWKSLININTTPWDRYLNYDSPTIRGVDPTEHVKPRIYTSAQDNGIAAYYDLYAAAHNGRRIPFPKLAEASNRAFPGENRDCKSEQNRFYQMTALPAKTDPYRDGQKMA